MCAGWVWGQVELSISAKTDQSADAMKKISMDWIPSS